MEVFKEKEIKLNRDGRPYVRVNGQEYIVILPPEFLGQNETLSNP